MELPQNIRRIIDEVTFKENEWWITMSVEHDISSENLLRIIRSQLPTLLTEQELHASLKYQLRDIIEAIHNFALSARNESTNSGIIVMAQFNLQKLSRAKRETVAELLRLESAPLMKVLESKVSLSNIPDLTLAKHHLALVDQKRMILAVSAQEAKLYEGDTLSEDTLLYVDVNPYIQPEHNRYYEQMGVVAGQAVRHGTGSEKVKRTAQSGLELFFKEQLRKTQSEFEFDSLNVYVSQQFAPLIENVTKALQEEVPNASTTIEVVSSDMFEDIVLDTEFNSISPDVSPLNKVTGLHEVVEALRMHRVSKVYIPETLEEKGYVTDEAQCYTYPFKDSRQVHSIRPWIFKLAHDSAAEIAVLENASQKPQISAVLRY